MSARALMIPSWTETVAALKAAEGVRVFQKCHACGMEHVVDLDALISEFGPLYSLWNRQPLGSIDVRAWGAGVTLDQLRERLRCRQGCEIVVGLIDTAEVLPAERPPMG